MRSKVLWFLLAASLALNVFFVAGVLYPQLMGHRHPPQRPDPVTDAAREFSLDERQTAALEALRNRIAERRNESRGEGDSFQSIILDALSQPTFDRAALALALEQRREGSGDTILDMIEDLHGFLAGLTPEQKSAFLERAQERDFLRRLLFPPRGDRQKGPPPR
ncbi:MAG: periplasmic heavy metal sensor [Kiloniellaceae bacterium]